MGNALKNRTHLPNIYLGVILLLMYVPIVLVIIYSFNESKISSVWDGFSLKWYAELFRDRSLFEALFKQHYPRRLVLPRGGCHRHARRGRLRKGRTQGKGRYGIHRHAADHDPEIILGMVFMVFFSLIGLPFGMTTLIIAHTAFCIPYVFMLVKARLVGMDKALRRPR